MDVLKIIGGKMYDFLVILWNLTLDIWAVIKNGITYFALGICVPVIISYLSIKAAIIIGPEEVGEPVDITWAMFIVFGMVLYAVFMLVAFVEYCKENKK